MAYGQFAIVGGLLPTATLADDLAEQFGLADDRQVRGVEPQAGVDGPLGDGQALPAFEKGREVVDMRQLESQGRQGLFEGFTTPRDSATNSTRVG